jgi:predicted  nucleic acid-binding Zn-ribbon protein
VDERGKSTRILQSKIADLEDQLARLQGRLEVLQRELKEAVEAGAGVERQVSEQRKLERADTELAERLAREISQAEASVEHERGRLRDARRAALAYR